MGGFIKDVGDAVSKPFREIRDFFAPEMPDPGEGEELPSAAEMADMEQEQAAAQRQAERRARMARRQNMQSLAGTRILTGGRNIAGGAAALGGSTTGGGGV